MTGGVEKKYLIYAVAASLNLISWAFIPRSGKETERARK
jgi:hypothetical protein